MKVLVTESIAEEGMDVLRDCAEVDIRLGLKPEELLALIGDYDALVVRSQTKVSAEVIDAGKKLQVIARAGVGIDNIDVATATRRGIVVGNAPTSNTISAAEHTIALMLALARHIPQANAALRSGVWKRDDFMGIEVRDKTLGIIGLGSVGSEVARRARGLEMKLIAHDPFISEETARELGVSLVDLDTLLAESDFISVHAPLNDQTRHMIDETALRKMKPTAILVNTARGGVVDTEALYKALKEGWINSAGLDVHETEPVPKDYPLFELDNVVISDHAGWYSEESIAELQRGAAEAVVAVLSGGWPKFLVNPEVKEIARRKWGGE